ncbi:flippase-like domain-containing protein [Flammeovirga pectinis]|uniref:Flippase-like domain-containing protein n=1 Tax=Flammeovirga pectinis TaxID=2494373 RepID=A0A3S9P3C1_9BACT|nr:lysylphosphatidylglycerol synthase transmembrane domain-containing protein [Flammeovirga pectinis]AZQ62572.1 flippase-like domain-containing protein [Flammeovirga pectinis]
MNLKDILKYLFSFILAGGLLWYVLKEQNLKEVLTSFDTIDWKIVVLSMAISLMSHYARGLRWGLMLKPLNYKTSGPNLFMATMSGYAGNLIIPRFGEFFRCGILQKLSKIPAKTSFGAVVAERAMDLIVFITLFLIAFFSQFDKLQGMILPHFNQQSDSIIDKIPYLIIGMVIIGLIGYFIFRIRKQLLRTAIVRKALMLLQGIIEGMTGVFKLKRKEFGLYFLYTFIIWLTYFYMGYVLFWTIQGTENLSPVVGFVMMMMGGLGMVLPTPGGTGSYHFFASHTLMAYGVSNTDAIAYAILMHTSQTFSVIIVGGISILIANLKKSDNSTIEDNE